MKSIAVGADKPMVRLLVCRAFKAGPKKSNETGGGSREQDLGRAAEGAGGV